MKVEEQLKNDKYNIFQFIKQVSNLEQNKNIIVFFNNDYEITQINNILQENIEYHAMFNNFKFDLWFLNNKEKLQKSIVFVEVNEINEKTKNRINKLREYSKEIIIQFNPNIALEKVKEYAKEIKTNAIIGYTNYETPDLRRPIMLLGKNFEYKRINNRLKILAMIHTYNEEDIIQTTLEYLMTQGIDVYVLDNWSTDTTFRKVQEVQKKYPDRITLKKFPDNKPEGNDYNWTSQLHETERLSKILGYDWYIHYDADEIRMSPFPDTTLADFINFVDTLGYNAIDTTVLNFRMTDKQDNIFGKNTYFELGRRPTFFMQTKTWKKCQDIDLATTGGHLAQFENQKVYPIKILNKHYPLRNIEQAEKKVFQDRLPRFEKEKKEKGWHGHYDKIAETKDFIYKKENLHKFDDNALEHYTLELISGIGIDKT